MAPLQWRAQRHVHQHPRRLLHDDASRKTTRAASKSTYAATRPLAATAPSRPARCSATRTPTINEQHRRGRHAEQRRAAGAQLPVQDRGQDPGAGWNNEFTLRDEWTLLADISYSKAQREQTVRDQCADTSPRPAPAPTQHLRHRHVPAARNSDMPSLHFGRDYADPAHVQVGPTIYGAGYTKSRTSRTS